MENQILNASAVKEAFLSGAAALDAQKDWINELNVFPVPDGDTGTNMTLTIMSAANEVAILTNPDMKTVCKAIAGGSLRGARGNSGVILSQLLRGFTNAIADNEELDIRKIALASNKAVETAYKAVMKPKEGTILTVARAMSEKAMEYITNEDPSGSNLKAFCETVLQAGDEALANTPNQLPVLKQAGVVDSGGQGLMVIVHAAVDSLLGNPVQFKGISEVKTSKAAGYDKIDTADIKFGYCTEFIINAEFSDKDESDFKAFLNSIGDSIVCVPYDDMVKVHVHTNDPGVAISKALTYGPLSRMKIDNMREEHNELYQKEAPAAKTEMPRKPYAVIAVSAGEGLNKIFEGIGVDRIISGGQTMNPSTEDFSKAIEDVHAEVVYLLPNNKNIIMAARQAAELAEDCRVFVVPTTSIQQGIAGMLSFLPEDTAEVNLENMQQTIENVKVASVTYAIRDTQIDGFDIHQGDYMAIGKNGMLACEKTKNSAALKALSELVDDSTALLTIYTGEEVMPEEAENLAKKISEMYPDMDVDMEPGGQPVYYYYIAVE